jgi:isocitrate lyase
VSKLAAACLASDVLRVPTALLARTDAEAATHIWCETAKPDLAFAHCPLSICAFVNLQQAKSAAADRGFNAGKHSREVVTRSFHAVTITVGGGEATAALKGSTEDEQFFENSRAAGVGGRSRKARMA